MEDTNLTTPVVQPPKINWLLFSLMGIVVLIAGIGIGFWVGKYIYTSKNVPSQTASISPTSTPDPTATWKTYSHHTLGYSFSYPQDASIETYDNSITVRIDPPDPRTIVGVCPRWISFSTSTSSSSAKKTRDEYGCIHNTLVLEQKIFVESQYSEKNQGVIDQILSTFKFIELSGESQPVGVKVTPPVIPADWTERVSKDSFYGVKLTLKLPKNYGIESSSEWTIGTTDGQGESWDVRPSTRANDGNFLNYYTGGSRREWYQRYLNDEFTDNTEKHKSGDISFVAEHGIGDASYLEIGVKRVYNERIETHFVYVSNGILMAVSPASEKASLDPSAMKKIVGTIFYTLNAGKL